MRMCLDALRDEAHTGSVAQFWGSAMVAHGVWEPRRVSGHGTIASRMPVPRASRWANAGRLGFFLAAAVFWTIIPVFMASLPCGSAPNELGNASSQQKPGLIMMRLGLPLQSLREWSMLRPENWNNCPETIAPTAKPKRIPASRLTRRRDAPVSETGHISGIWPPNMTGFRDHRAVEVQEAAPLWLAIRCRAPCSHACGCWRAHIAGLCRPPA